MALTAEQRETIITRLLKGNPKNIYISIVGVRGSLQLVANDEYTELTAMSDAELMATVLGAKQ